VRCAVKVFAKTMVLGELNRLTHRETDSDVTDQNPLRAKPIRPTVFG